MQWRNYRAYLKTTTGWSMAEMASMPWDEFIAELEEARRMNTKEND